jgi:hypothetical protein
MTRSSLFALLLVTLSTLTSCEAIGDIFQAGMWMGVIVVVLVIALVLWLLRKIRK